MEEIPQNVKAGTRERVGVERSRGWLYGAYVFLFLWSAAYLLLFFMGRLPG